MTAPAIVADSDDIRLLATQLRAATADATRAASSVHQGLGLADLAFAGGLDPVGAVSFEAAAARVLMGPFGLSGIETDLAQLATSLGHAAEGYLEADLLAAADALAGPALATLTALAALIPPDSTPTVTAVGPVSGSAGPPRNLTDLMTRLAQLDDSREKGRGEIDIETLTGTDAAGRPVRKVIAYLPGVDDENPLDRDDVNDITNAARPVDGLSSTYEYGVLDALRAAGVRPGDDVTLVGHSQGGAVAVNTARDAVNSGQFNITHVITAGAPIGIAALSLPSSVKVLAIENKDDPVPLLDGRANPSRANITTVDVFDPHLDPLDGHDLSTSYLPATQRLEAGNDPAVRKYLASDSDTFDLDQSSTVRYSITPN